MRNGVLFMVSMALVSGCALAQNGPVQINQATVAASGNRTTGGFPYIITQPGSYQLTGNLTVPAGVGGIGIAASNVTLDLNGFNITCSPSMLLVSAIYAVGSPSMISVRNGTIIGPLNGIGVSLGNHGTMSGINVQDLMISGTYSAILADSNAIVRHNIATGLIEVLCPSVIAENVTTGFITTEVGAGGVYCVLWNNRALNFTNPVQQ